MTPLHVCRYCDGLITDPDDAVAVAHELGMSGPGWTVWAHREHAALVEPNADAIRILARVLIARALSGH
ncbi:hypothetical protein [Streptomyces sp. NBC_01092]|uniref:hypothetical protein n=1 Tax=Streptomyces sp. NBC_01092 TaxID=2903748 RepID=UPI00386A3CB1|nr:hypothetical protein OG254_12435 [Streptomyces sp. NBC_01092]